MIRKATINDLDDIEIIYNKVLDQEEEGKASIGWTRWCHQMLLARESAEDLWHIMSSMPKNKVAKTYAWIHKPRTKQLVIYTINWDMKK